MTVRVDELTTFSRMFQTEEAAAGKARLPTVESLTDGTIRRLVAAAALTTMSVRKISQLLAHMGATAFHFCYLTSCFRRSPEDLSLQVLAHPAFIICVSVSAQ